MNAPISAAVAAQHVRTVALGGYLSPRREFYSDGNETLTVERFGAAAGWPRHLGHAQLHQQARENITQQGEAAEDRELGIGHSGTTAAEVME